jgi:branched-chain amino acid aminotransferase
MTQNIATKSFDFTQMKVFMRDKFVGHDEATITISNTCFLYGLGVFSGLRANYNSESDQLYLFRPHEHYKRLVYQARMCHFRGFLEGFSEEKFIAMLSDLLRVNGIRQDAYIRVTLFSDSNSITPKFVGYKDSISAFLYPLGHYLNPTGVRCMTSTWVRIQDSMIPARGKLTGAYLNTALAKTEALLADFDEAIFLDSGGHVVEASAANIFLVLDGILVTPPLYSDILEGITRRSVITLAREMGISVQEREVDRTELYKADEIFLTGTGAQITPVIEVDRRAVGSGKIGQMTQILMQLYWRVTLGKETKYANWVTEVKE